MASSTSISTSNSGPPPTTYREAIFWDVDTQADFALPDGKLYAPGAERILVNLGRLTEYARRQRILVVASLDAHSENDPEFAQWPVHCLAGTAGQRKVETTRMERAWIMPLAPTALPDDLSQFQQILIEKRTVDVFSNPNVGALLARLGRPEVTLYGLVTEVCVELAACGLLRRGYRVRLVTDAVWPLKEEDGRRSLEQLERSGARLVTTAEVTGDTPPESRPGDRETT